MNNSFENMKDSGVAWIGKIPEHWELSKMKRVLRNASIKGHPEAQVLSLYREYGVIPKDSRDDNHNVTSEDTASYKYVENGDLVINKMKAWQGSLGLSQYEGIVSPAYYVCKFISNRISRKFLHHLIRSKAYAQEFERLSTGMRVGQWDLGIDDFLRVPLLLPPLSEQAAIAAYLDEKCAAIDGIIAEAKASIDDYKAWKSSVIFEAVTKGLDPNADMKDSGVEWIGRMPCHWRISRLQSFYRIKKDIAEKTGYTVLSVTQQGVKPKNMNSKGQFALDYSKYQIVKKGDFVMNHMDLLTGGVGISAYDGVTSPDYRVFSSRTECRDLFYKYIFQYCYLNRVFYGLGHGVADVGRWRLPADMFRKFMLPVPPLPEQESIAAYLDEKCAAIDGIIAEKESLIAELETYKKSLIFETVTGKRRVC